MQREILETALDGLSWEWNTAKNPLFLFYASMTTKVTRLPQICMYFFTFYIPETWNDMFCGGVDKDIGNGNGIIWSQLFIINAIFPKLFIIQILLDIHFSV